MDLTIGKLDNSWIDTNEIVIYGLGFIGRLYIEKLSEQFNVYCIVDNSPGLSGGYYKNIPIYSQKQAKEQIRGKKIVVTSRLNVYQDIANTLELDGFTEYKDFCLLDLFISQWFLYKENKLVLFEVHTTITTRCSLKCEKCNMFMPYYKKHYDMDFEDFKDNMDLFFQKVDYVYRFVLLGGEPFINKELAKMLRYLIDRYGDRIGDISIITNGTIKPDESTIEAIKVSKATLLISDYTKTVDYRSRFNDTINCIKENGINYYVNESLIWTDFGFPEKPCQYTNENVREHMLSCYPIFKGYNDKKFYFCHVSWSAEKAGLYKLKEQDYYLIEDIDKNDIKSVEKFLNYSLGQGEAWHLSFCNVCGGCGSDNQNYIEVALQCERCQ